MQVYQGSGNWVGATSSTSIQHSPVGYEEEAIGLHPAHCVIYPLPFFVLIIGALSKCFLMVGFLFSHKSGCQLD